MLCCKLLCQNIKKFSCSFVLKLDIQLLTIMYMYNSHLPVALADLNSEIT